MRHPVFGKFLYKRKIKRISYVLQNIIQRNPNLNAKLTTICKKTFTLKFIKYVKRRKNRKRGK